MEQKCHEKREIAATPFIYQLYEYIVYLISFKCSLYLKLHSQNIISDIIISFNIPN